MELQRLRQLSQGIPQAQYKLGQIVEITPVEFDTFGNDTLALVLAVHAFNDSEGNIPYVGYSVQVTDSEPSEINDFFDGFDYENVEIIFETQITRVLD
ncbi:hypothetical protein QGP82_23720 [Leptothoe sp. LEGE 181152]|nr:hypothetical protein [Leptothoe sp. LEGE 181152]